MYERESNGYLVIFTWLIYIVFGIYLFNFSYYTNVKVLSQNAEMPEEQFGFTGDYFYSFLEKLGDAGQAVYFNFQLLDYINLVLLGFTLCITIRHFLIKLETRNLYYVLLIFPVFFILLDVMENSLILYLILKLPSRFYTLSKLASDLTQLKLVFFIVSFLSFLFSGIILLFKTLNQKLRINRNE